LLWEIGDCRHLGFESRSVNAQAQG
jgi:hypothetical protein